MARHDETSVLCREELKTTLRRPSPLDERLVLCNGPITTCLMFCTRARGKVGGLRVKAEEGAEASRYRV